MCVVLLIRGPLFVLEGIKGGCSMSLWTRIHLSHVELLELYLVAD